MGTRISRAAIYDALNSYQVPGTGATRATISASRLTMITGAMAVVRSALRKGSPEGSWVQRMLARKPRMLVAIALANKMARSIWAMLAKAEDYRVPMAAAA